MDRIENLDCLLSKQKELEHTMDIRKANHDNTEYLELLICGGTGCVSSQSLKLLENLNQEIRNHGLENSARASITGCFGFCEKGPIVKVFPEDVFYVGVKPLYVERKQHLSTPSREEGENLQPSLHFLQKADCGASPHL